MFDSLSGWDLRTVEKHQPRCCAELSKSVTLKTWERQFIWQPGTICINLRGIFVYSALFCFCFSKEKPTFSNPPSSPQTKKKMNKWYWMLDDKNFSTVVRWSLLLLWTLYAAVAEHSALTETLRRVARWIAVFLAKVKQWMNLNEWLKVPEFKMTLPNRDSWMPRGIRFQPLL